MPIKRKVITHNGRFHADEVLACALLTIIYESIDLVRTRDQQEIERQNHEENAIVVDVGGVYDPATNRFDHHQSDFNEYYNDDAKRMGVPLSSCGLVYKHYKDDLLDIFLRRYLHTTLSPEDRVRLQDKVYFACFFEFDAGDNGVVTKSTINTYPIYTRAHLISFVSLMNWPVHDNDEAQLYEFKRVKSVLGLFLTRKIDQIIRRHCTFNTILFDMHNTNDMKLIGKRIVMLNQDITAYDGIGTLKAVLNHIDTAKTFLYILVRNKKMVRLYTMPGKTGPFSMRAPLLFEEEARQAVGDQLVFIHPKRFTGGCKDMESAVKIASLSVERHYSRITCTDRCNVAIIIVANLVLLVLVIVVMIWAFA